MEFSKKPTQIEEQLSLLEARGLLIENRERTKHYLEKVGYYRLSSYALPFQIKDNSNHQFKDNVKFDSIFKLYLFDRELRILIFDKVEKIEVAVRAAIVNHMCLKYGSHWYEDESLFKKWFQHDKLIDSIKKLVEESKEVFVKHYTTKYSSPDLPPSWMTFELLTFGQIQNIYRALPNEDKSAIANQFCLHRTIFESWLLTINMVRNICAHHSRLWNRELGIKPKLPKNQIHTIEFSNNRLYAILFVIKYLLNTITPGSDFKDQIKQLFETAPFKPTYSIGLPSNWEKDPVWEKPTKPY